MNRYFAIPVFALALALPPSVGNAKTVNQLRNAPTGKSHWIDAYYGWNDDCSFKTINVDVVDPPANGAVTPRIENQRIKQAQVGNTGACVGKPTKAVAVYYKSKSGYRGSDAFTVRMSVAGQPPVFFVYRVNVN